MATSTPSPEALFDEGRRTIPRWGQPDPGGGKRRRALNLLRKAATAGHRGAMKLLADGFDHTRAAEWALALARLGDNGPLVSALTNTDFPPSLGAGVLAAARAGEAWALHAVGSVYALGMEDAAGEPVARRDGAWGWLPGAPDPNAEGAAWVERAAALGWAPASMSLVYAHRVDDPDRALRHLLDALARPDTLDPRDHTRAAQLYAELAERIGAPFEEQLRARRALADQGDEDAWVWLAERHRTGQGLPVDLPAARALYGRAADAGSVEGARELARMMETGLGGPEDADGARLLYERAAELGGDAYARDRLATRFGLTWYARGPAE